MEKIDVVIGVFADHQTAETAIKKLAVEGFAMQIISVIGRGYPAGEKVIGLYSSGDHIKFWGVRSGFWGGLWSLFSNKAFMILPTSESVVVLGHLASDAISAAENGASVGELGAIGAALCTVGVPKHKLSEYESDIKADNFLVMVRSIPEDAVHAREILGTASPIRLDVHRDVMNTTMTDLSFTAKA